MSLFTRTCAGVFPATRTERPNIAESICAAVSEKIAGSTEKVLQPAWWNTCVGMIPMQSLANRTTARSSIYRMNISGGLANLCISSAFRKTSTGNLTAGVEGLLAELPHLQSLNSLCISFAKNGELQISLAILAVEETDSSAETWPVSVDRARRLWRIVMRKWRRRLTRRLDHSGRWKTSHTMFLSALAAESQRRDERKCRAGPG